MNGVHVNPGLCVILSHDLCNGSLIPDIADVRNYCNCVQ